MRPLLFKLPLLAVLLLAEPAVFANPVSYGQQLCVMLKSGISQQKAWEYIVKEHTKSATANPQLMVPWFSTAAAGWSLGTTLGNLDNANQELIALKPDVFKVARASCPERFR